MTRETIERHYDRYYREIEDDETISEDERQEQMLLLERSARDALAEHRQRQFDNYYEEEW